MREPIPVTPALDEGRRVRVRRRPGIGLGRSGAGTALILLAFVMLPGALLGYFSWRAIQRERFWILTHPEWKAAVKHRMENILEERDPTPARPR